MRLIPRIEVGSSLDVQKHFGGFAQRYNQILAAKLPAGSAAAVAAVKGLAPRNKWRG